MYHYGQIIHINNSLCLYLFILKSQGTYQFTNFSMGPSSGEVFTTNNFKAINAGIDGIIWAGTQYGGLYRFDTTYKTWTKSDHLTNVLINDIKPDREKGI